jgi:LysM repeat protein
LHGTAPLTITVTAGQTVNAIAMATGYTNSAVATVVTGKAPPI